VRCRRSSQSTGKAIQADAPDKLGYYTAGLLDWVISRLQSVSDLLSCAAEFAKLACIIINMLRVGRVN
jgi:hypothetical protein